MENRKLDEMYQAMFEDKKGEIDGQLCLVLKLDAKVDDVAYPSRKIWVDEKRQIPLKSELYAKSGKLLKLVEVKEVKLFGKRWYPISMVYRDTLKEGKGTKIMVDSIEFDPDVPSSRFNKSALAK